MPDIDIDVAPSFKLEKVFPTAVRASMMRGDELVPHNVGVYFQTVPVDPLLKVAAYTFERGEELGAQKIDFLNLSAYSGFTSRDDFIALANEDPDWTLLKIPSVVAKLDQIKAQFEIVSKIAPVSILELADCLALIRPQKRYLIEKYLTDPAKWRQALYSKGLGEGYGFKKGHAVAYAQVIVVQMHLVKAGLL